MNPGEVRVWSAMIREALRDLRSAELQQRLADLVALAEFHDRDLFTRDDPPVEGGDFDKPHPTEGGADQAPPVDFDKTLTATTKPLPRLCSKGALTRGFTGGRSEIRTRDLFRVRDASYP